jgi:dihydrofolate synthase/folylpolyglutamate synthase
MAEIALSEHLQYMYGLERFGIRLGLDTMRALLGTLNNPHEQFRSIHLTGTNGKGSTAAMLESVLRAQGIRTALYTSPHLYQFNERVRVAGEPISDAELLALIQDVREAAGDTIHPTFFEFTTALAFLHFARAQADIAVIEVGMGGTLDATNVITPLVSVITNVGLDHTPILGNNVAEIAANKAGVIKPGRPVVTHEKNPELLEIFKKISQEKEAAVHIVSEEFVASSIQATLEDQTFSAAGEKYAIPLLGKHQIDNACTALAVLSVLQKQGIEISQQAIKEGLQSVKWEGRLDIVSRQPFILVDGAHNNEGIQALATFLDETPLPPPDVLVVAVKNDKDISLLLEKIVPRFKHIIVTEGNYEPAPAEKISSLIEPQALSVQAIPNVAAALATGKKLLSPNGMMLVTGSLYMIGDALTVLRHP